MSLCAYLRYWIEEEKEISVRGIPGKTVGRPGNSTEQAGAKSFFYPVFSHRL